MSQTDPGDAIINSVFGLNASEALAPHQAIQDESEPLEEIYQQYLGQNFAEDEIAVVRSLEACAYCGCPASLASVKLMKCSICMTVLYCRYVRSLALVQSISTFL